MPDSDEQLMLAYAGGDAAAFEALYTRHKGPLYRFVLRSAKGEAQAEEIFQEVWMRAIEARGRYRPEAKFTTWLYTIAHNRMVDHWRAKGLSLVSLDHEERAAVEPVAPPSAEPHANLEASRTAARLAEAIAALPLVQREALLMHLEGELSVAQLAAATGSNEEAAKSRLRYAIAKLKDAIGDD